MNHAVTTRPRLPNKPSALQFKKPHLRKSFFLAAALTFGTGAALADSVTVSDDNSSLKYTRDDPIYNIGLPSDPVQLPRTIEWTVDGRRILVYPSGPSTFLDIGHLHPNAHVAIKEIHAQGPMIGYGTAATAGTVLGGVVYSVDGGAPGSGKSRIWEKADIVNNTGGPLQVWLTGMGFKPTQASLEVPDLNGLKITGTTIAFHQGATGIGTSITDPPFAPITVLPAVSFFGFNPLLNQSLSLPAGATLTMVTELNVESLGLKALDVDPGGDDRGRYPGLVLPN